MPDDVEIRVMVGVAALPDECGGCSLLSLNKLNLVSSTRRTQRFINTVGITTIPQAHYDNIAG